MALKVDGKDLYAVAIEKLGPDGQPCKGKVFYIHAASAVEAKWHYQMAFPNRGQHRIVGAAPALGFYVQDRDGKIVSAT